MSLHGVEKIVDQDEPKCQSQLISGMTRDSQRTCFGRRLKNRHYCFLIHVWELCQNRETDFSLERTGHSEWDILHNLIAWSALLLQIFSNY